MGSSPTIGSSASLMAEHVTVNHMMRVRFPRGTMLSSIIGIVVVCKTIGVGSSPISALGSSLIGRTFILGVKG